jgi:hypothetical protein
VTITAAPAFKAISMAGTEARTRVSSVISPASFKGTFRSARMKTRCPWALPWAHRSEKRMMFMQQKALRKSPIQRLENKKSACILGRSPLSGIAFTRLLDSKTGASARSVTGFQAFLSIAHMKTGARSSCFLS